MGTKVVLLNYILFSRFLTNSLTTLGSDRVEVSPSCSCSLAAIFLNILLIILPERVFGKAVEKWIISGVAIGPIATPDFIQFSSSLPKTRSGKIMRRILRKIAANEHDQLGDTTTLADPTVVESLVNERKNKQ